MRRVRKWGAKPVGWSWDAGWARRTVGYKWGVWGGSLHLDGTFHEWFFRIPLLGLSFCLRHIEESDVLSNRP